MDGKKIPQVVIIGGGFGGLNAARTLERSGLGVVLIDRKNHHTFQPLLYQVATAGLSPADIAAPIRWILRRGKKTEVLLAEVVGFDLEQRLVKLAEGGEIPYDYLIVAAGAQHSYFGHDEWALLAPGLKSIEDAVEIRRRVLLAFELAERQALSGTRPMPLNFVIIGGGPTGVEVAGTLAEIANNALAHDFAAIDPKTTKVVLLEGGPRVLPAYPEDLSRSAEEQLRKLGVEVHTSTMVTKVDANAVEVGAKRLPAAVVLWAAGVAASPLGKKLGAPVDRAGRVLVEPDLSLPGHPEVFVIGDLASIKDDNGKPVPGLAPAAIQEGKAAAKNVLRDVEGKRRENFHYWDKGSLATIGRAAAVAQFGRVHISGFFAWISWLFIHLFFLIGFRNRVIVMLEWAWSYFTYQRGARLITGSTTLPSWQATRASTARVHEAAAGPVSVPKTPVNTAAD
jgi:NADH:ubiquinone reductase (H+-translocating)